MQYLPGILLLWLGLGLALGTDAEVDLAKLNTFCSIGKELSVLKGYKEAELLRHEGKGCLTHAWFGGDWSGYERTCVRTYADGEKRPSIEMELGLGHGYGFGDSNAPWGNDKMGKTGHPSGLYNTHRIPFGTNIRVTAQRAKDSPDGAPFWWIIRGTENLTVTVAGVSLHENARLNDNYPNDNDNMEAGCPCAEARRLKVVGKLKPVVLKPSHEPDQQDQELTNHRRTQNKLMNKRILTLICLSIVPPIGQAAEAQPAVSDGPFKPEWRSLKAHQDPKCFRDAKFGFYTHWGPVTLGCEDAPQGGEWYGRVMYLTNNPIFTCHRGKFGDQRTFGSQDVIPRFTAMKFDPGKWADLFVRAGAKFAGPVAVPHDNIAMWDSAASPSNSVRMGPKRDITGVLAKDILI